MNIVENVKRTREAAHVTTAASVKSGTIMEVVKAPPRTDREDLENFAGAGKAGGEKGEHKAAGNALFQVQAPGSVFDHKHQIPIGNTGSKGSSATSSPSASALGVLVQQRQGLGQATKTPLKSALKNTSRTPSPSPLVVSAPLPLAASASAPRVSTTTNSKSQLGPPLSITGQGLADAENESAHESAEEFFTDEGESEFISADGRGEDNPVIPSVTVQTPRKRKSVRVSLKPTFSPSPPAIEYEEASSSYHFENHQPVPTKPQTSSHGEGKRHEKWADSSDEDEEYNNAKAALSRAARKDKEVSLSVFGH
jgi:hypothetical protein